MIPFHRQSVWLGILRLAGISSAVLGKLADATSIVFVIKVYSFLPLIGLLTGLLPDLKDHEHVAKPK